MRMLALAILMAGPSLADTVVATRTLPAQTIVGPGDLVIQAVDVPGAVSDPLQIIGMETRVALYAGRPIRLADVGAPAIVERNQIIIMSYQSVGITVTTEGRVLDRAGPGDLVRVMNLASRTTVTARMGEDGVAYVSQ